MNSKVIMTILFFGLLFFVVNLSPVEADWDDPACAPPGCNRPEPITVEGGTVDGELIISGDTLIVRGQDGADTVLNSSEATIGVPFQSVYNSQEAISVVEYKDMCSATSYPSQGWGADNCFELITYPANSGQEVSYFKKRIIAADGISLPAEANITLPGGGRTGAIEVSNTMNDWYGYGIHARSLAPNIDPDNNGIPYFPLNVWNGYMWVSSDPNDEQHPDFRDMNPAIWGQSYSDTTTGVHMLWRMFDQDTKEFLGLPDEHNFAVMAQSQGGYSIGLHTRAHRGAIGAYLTGYTIMTNGIAQDFKVWQNDITGSSNGGLHTAFHGNSSNGYDPDVEYRPLEIFAREPDAVYFGGILPDSTDGETVKICLNDTGNGQQCISSWGDVASTQSTGNKVFKTIAVPTGDNSQAENAADILTLTNGDNISIRGINGEKNTIEIATTSTLAGIDTISGTPKDYLYLDGDNSYGIKVYDKLTVDGSVMADELCIGNTCLTESELQVLKDWIAKSAN